MNPIPAAKIQMMRGSLRCLIFGALGLLPLIGLPFALAALWLSGRVCVQEKLFWNPAKLYRIWGVVAGALGTILGIVLLAMIIVRICLGP